MKARPSFQFYPADWLRDPGLRSCSLAARGLWIDLLSFMHEAEPYGHLRLNGHDVGIEALGRMVGIPAKELQRYLSELEAAGVFSRTEAGTIFSRRMVRDEVLREKRAAGGHLSLQNPAVPRRKEAGVDAGKDTLSPSLEESSGGSPSSSSSFSSSKKKDIRADVLNGHRANFDRFWSIYPKKRGKGEAEKVWAKLHPDDALVGAMVSKIEQAKRTPDWMKEGGQFIPYPATWLNAKGWEDEYGAVSTPTQRRIPL